MEFKALEITTERTLLPLEADAIAPTWLTDETYRWLDVTRFQKNELKELLIPLDLRPDILEACVTPQTRPKVIALEKSLFLSLPVFDKNREISYFTIVCVSTTLITIRHKSIALLDDTSDYYVGDRRLIAMNTAALVLELLEAGLKETLPIFYQLRDDVINTAKTLDQDASSVQADDLLDLRRRAVPIALLLEDQLFTLTELRGGRSETLALSSIQTYVADHISDLERSLAQIARLDESIRDLYQHHLNYVQQITNRRLNILTVLSAIYLPSTLMAGIYGMNFKYIPILELEYGYFVVLLLMIALVLGQVWFFHSRGWFK